MSEHSQARRADVDRAYELQAKSGAQGAAKALAIGLGVVTVGHYSWPLFRRQTLPFKGFIVSIFTIFGLVLGAEQALLTHEAQRRQEENSLRREARLDLARRGLIATEREIAKWKAEKEKMTSNPASS